MIAKLVALACVHKLLERYRMSLFAITERRVVELILVRFKPLAKQLFLLSL